MLFCSFNSFKSVNKLYCLPQPLQENSREQRKSSVDCSTAILCASIHINPFFISFFLILVTKSFPPLEFKSYRPWMYSQLMLECERPLTFYVLSFFFICQFRWHKQKKKKKLVRALSHMHINLFDSISVTSAPETRHHQKTPLMQQNTTPHAGSVNVEASLIRLHLALMHPLWCIDLVSSMTYLQDVNFLRLTE